MALERSVEIERPPEEVFAFIADARNDPRWCGTVATCEQRAGDGPGPGARYEARHKPTPFHRVMPRSIEVLEYAPPRALRSRQEDANGVFDITYEVEPTARGARLTQRDEIDWSVPGPVGRMAERLFVRRHIGEQMGALKRLLESAVTREPLASRVFGSVTGTVAPLARFPAGRAAQRWFTAAHNALYRRLGVGLRIGNAPILLLTTTGRRSGEARTVPLMYVPAGEPVLVASNGGSPTHPAWYLNLLSEPQATIEVGEERRRVVARTVTGPERGPLWQRAVANYPAYERYQRRVQRELPVVVLESAVR